MASCRHFEECSERETMIDRLEFCLEEVERGSFRGCPYDYVKLDDTVFKPVKEL